MIRFRYSLFAGIVVCCTGVSSSVRAQQIPAERVTELFGEKNLVAWCIVPFDGKKRGPVERAAMLSKLKLGRCAYDWRAEHVATFEQEILEYKKRGIEFFAFWDQHDAAFALFEKHGLRPQIWKTLSSPKAPTQDERVRLAARAMLPLVGRTRKLGSKLGLYNHGGWGGEPANLVAVCEYLREHHDGGHVGIVYNQHHGHGHIDGFAELLEKMIPYLLCLNLNGMNTGARPKILQIGQGEHDLKLLRVIARSKYRGPIGVIGHTQDDVELRLRDNLEGLDWLRPQLRGFPPGARPVPSTPTRLPLSSGSAARGVASLSPAFGRALSGGVLLDGRTEYRTRPLTIECRAKLDHARGFNILVASDTKSSAEHWELYSYSGSGVLSLYQPGRGLEFKSEVNICDGKWHALAAIIEPARVRLFVDGKLVLDRKAPPRKGDPMPGKLAIGRLVSGEIGCAGVIDDVRISKGARTIGVPSEKPLERDEATIDLWSFDDLASRRGGAYDRKASDPWAIEDPAERAKLPPERIVAAAPLEELTPANGFPSAKELRRWTRSHGGDECLRYSGATQIDRENVHRLEVAWTYHSKDGRGNIQCNPIVVGGVLYAPTVGGHVVAVNATNGDEIWRFRADRRPAFRGITWWPGGYGSRSRLFFATEGRRLYALDPITGKPDVAFGGGKGWVPLREGARVAPAVFERTIVIAGYLRDVEAFDVVTGESRWRFHSVPREGEYGFDTWEKTQPNAANCWGGMALDPKRGIVYISTGSPKPNFRGMEHHGDNLFSNCVVAIDARDGKRLWHFQEIPHDIWDLDIPAPPVLTTIRREGKAIDVVAAVSKTGNTLLLDRVTGKPIFPVRYRRAPVSDVPGEKTSAYQLDLELPEPFSRQVFKPEESPKWGVDALVWAEQRYKSLRHGWFLPVSHRKVTAFYGVHGGAEWTGACSDPTNGRLFVTANEVPWLMSLINVDEPRRDPKAPPTAGREVYEKACMECHGSDRMGVGVSPPLVALKHRVDDAKVLELLKTGRGLMPANETISDAEKKALLDYLFVRDIPGGAQKAERPVRPQFVQNRWSRFIDPEGYPAVEPPWGTLNCLDLNTGKLLWKVPLGEHEALTKRGVPITGTENFGGASVTAGGVVFAAGTKDLKIRAFDVENGQELWSYKLPFGGFAPPTIYEADGRQFVVIAATGGGKLGGQTGDAYVAFALPK